MVLLLVAAAIGACAQQDAASRLTRVVLFKQGYGLMVREVTLPAGAKEVRVADMPAPVHGTFWIVGTMEQLAKITATATTGDRVQSVPAVTLPELLQANVGEVIEVKTPDGWTSGTLLSVAENRNRAEKSAALNPERAYLRAMATDAANLLVLKTAQGPTALPVSSVMQVRKPAGTGELTMTFSRKEPGAVLRLRSDGQAGTVQICYLTYGITWAPSYRLELGNGTARMSGKAVVINDIEDINTPELACVAGFPNIKFANVLDPLSMQVSMSQFFASLQYGGSAEPPPVMGQMAITANSAVAYNDIRPITHMPRTAPPTLPNDTADMHLYRFQDVTVGTGDRAYLPFLDKQIASKEIFRWNPRAYRYGGEDSASEVWHLVRLINNTNVPWTTAPLMITQGDALLGQDILSYTPPGAHTEVRITKAINVKATLQEESAGGAESVVINKVTYKKYLTTGTMHVTNGTGKTIRMEINLDVDGDVTATSQKPLSMIELPRRDIANPRKALTWETMVPAGQTLEITYTYKQFLR